MEKVIRAFFRRNKWLIPFAYKARALKLNLVGKAIWGSGNKIHSVGKLSNIKVDIIGKNNIINVKRGTKLSNVLIHIRGDNNLVNIYEDCNYAGGSIWIEDNGCELDIGSKTTIVSAHFAITEPGSKIIIGEDCMFAYGIDFRTGDSHSILDLASGKRINYSQDIKVDNHVWIGVDVKVLKGVHIKSGSIIGTGAVVTSNIPENCVAGGNPAKILKDQVEWCRDRVYDK